jgi:hypothetical protein
MNPKHFHTPVSTRLRCPVCHEAVYSRAGIHPQCAVRQSDPPKPKKVKEPASLSDQAAPTDGRAGTDAAGPLTEVAALPAGGLEPSPS